MLVLTSDEPISPELEGHARALAGPGGSVTVGRVRAGALARDARDALAGGAFTTVLVGLDDPAVGDVGACELAEELGESGPLLLILAPPGEPPRAV